MTGSRPDLLVKKVPVVDPHPAPAKREWSLLRVPPGFEVKWNDITVSRKKFWSRERDVLRIKSDGKWLQAMPGKFGRVEVATKAMLRDLDSKRRVRKLAEETKSKKLAREAETGTISGEMFQAALSALTRPPKRRRSKRLKRPDVLPDGFFRAPAGHVVKKNGIPMLEIFEAGPEDVLRIKQKPPTWFAKHEW